MTILAVGIDVGNGKCVVAVSRDGVADAVLNEASKRETATVVHFCGDHRLFGSSRTAGDPKSAIDQLKRLVIHDDRNDLLQYETSTDSDVGTTVVVVHYLGEQQQFTAEQMLGMLLAHLKRTAEHTLGGLPISSCVIGIPAYLDDKQRNAYRYAAEIAGLKPLQLLHDGLATATEYGIYRGASAATNVVAFVDVGHCNTQVTVVRFTGQEFELLAEASDCYLGGRDFDNVVFQHFKKMFESRYNVSIDSSIKAIARLRTACEKAKRVLSSNKEADVNIDYLMEGVEYASGVITREEFEQSSGSLLDRIVDKCREAMEGARLDIKDVSSVELVGSGSRIPAISRRLVEFFDRELSRTLNGSESVARGCALLCEKLLQSGDAGDQEGFDGSERKQLGDEIRREKELLEQDEAVKRAKDKRNDLEALIYDIPKKLERKGVEGEGEDFHKLLDLLSNIEDWLNGDGSDASFEEYQTRFNEVESMVISTGLLSKEEIHNQSWMNPYIGLSDEEMSTGSREEQSSCPNRILCPWYFLRAVACRAKDFFSWLMLSRCNHDQIDDKDSEQGLLGNPRPRSSDQVYGSGNKAKTKSREEQSSCLNWVLCPWFFLRAVVCKAKDIIVWLALKAKGMVVWLVLSCCNHDQTDDEEGQQGLLGNPRPRSPDQVSGSENKAKTM